MSDNDAIVRVVLAWVILGIVIICAVGIIAAREAEQADVRCTRALELTCGQPQSLACQTALRCLVDLDARHH